MNRFCFYLDWSGLSAEAWAAWSQVLVAVAIGAAAIYVPVRLESLGRRRRIEAALTLCGLTAFQFLQAADQANTRARNLDSYRYFVATGQQMLAALREIPSHELIRWEVVQTRIYVESRCIGLLQFLDQRADPMYGFEDLQEADEEQLGFLTGLLRTSVREVSDLLKAQRPAWRRIKGRLSG